MNNKTEKKVWMVMILMCLLIISLALLPDCGVPHVGRHPTSAIGNPVDGTPTASQLIQGADQAGQLIEGDK